MNSVARILALRTVLGLATLAGCGSEEADEPAAAPPALAPEPTLVVEEGFTLLSLDDFEVFAEKPAEGNSWRESGGRIEGAGQPRGYLYTKAAYGDFTLRLDVRYPTANEEEDPAKLNTGVLLFVEGGHRVWPRCLEVQGRWDELAQVKSNARDVAVEVTDDPAARDSARKAPGEWNTLEIVARGGAVTAFLNGTKVAEGRPTELRGGPIGLQAEGNPVHFRHVRVRRDE